ncbi:hypothetical protein H0A64_15940, partial [Alcaligenaceae bacterium]|nr:hypothetical protein [Alcaligenaceae bacterium]
GKAHDSEEAAALSESNAHDSEEAAALSAGAALVSEGKAHDSEVAAGASEAKSKAYLESLTQPFAFYKPDYNTPCMVKTGAQTLSIKAGTVVVADAVAHAFGVDTPITMPTLVAGSDYSVWVNADGTAQAVLDMYGAPATAPTPGAKKIGGFHYGLVAPGTTVASGSFATSGVTSAGGSMGWLQADVDKLAGINQFSIWDLAFRCKGEQRGMTYDPYKQMWAGIYFVSDSPHIYGPSAYNTNIASGSVLPFVSPAYGGDGILKYATLNAFSGHEILAGHGLRYPTYDEFMSFAFGVTEGQSLGGAASTVPATLRQPGYTSRIGIEQATGHQIIIGGPVVSSHGTVYAANGRGSWFGSTSLVMLGGGRSDAANSGSRFAGFSNPLALSSWGISVRAAGDHLKLGAQS